MIKITNNFVYDVLNKSIAPVAYCESGDTIIFETRDCYDDAVTSSARPLGDRLDIMENPATGPLYVHGANAGDVLKIEIVDIKLRPWAVMRSSIQYGAFSDCFEKREAQIFDISDGKIRFDDKLTIEFDTMIGVIGTAPKGEGIPTTTPGSHGGNMDCRKIVKDSILYLPVNVDGGLLSIGDIHARMGDGEVLICGMETSGEVTVKVTVVKNCTLPTPFLYYKDRVMTIQSAKTLDDAGYIAVRKMHGLVKEVTGYNDLKAGMLMSLLSDMVVCQIVDPLMTMRVEFPLADMCSYGFVLP